MSHDEEPTLPGQEFAGSGSRPREAVIPSRIGRYTLRRRIATGGMGTVYEAIQDEPRRTVAPRS